MYIFGGYQFSYERYVSSLYQFDPETLSWYKMKTFGLRGPTGRERHCGIVVGDCAYIFGGEL